MDTTTIPRVVSLNMSELPLRPNVCMLVYSSDYRLFLGARSGVSGVWQFPQGGVELEQSLEENVIRELEEELGIERHHIGAIQKLEATNEYDFAKPPDYAKGRWRGQSQTYWVVKFTGKNRDIDVSRRDKEFSDWKWATPNEVREIAEPRRLGGYEKALREFEQLVADGKL